MDSREKINYPIHHQTQVLKSDRIVLPASTVAECVLGGEAAGVQIW
jgi:hypothetical protein